MNIWLVSEMDTNELSHLLQWLNRWIKSVHTTISLWIRIYSRPDFVRYFITMSSFYILYNIVLPVLNGSENSDSKQPPLVQTEYLTLES